MYAVIETGGKQYRVEVGTELEIERIEADPGASVAFDRVLLVADGDAASIGRPVLANASVAAEVVRRDRGEKLISFKYRPKARRRVKKGHRQELTLVRISDIVLDGKSAADEAEKAEERRKTERERLEEGARRQAEQDAALAAKLAADRAKTATAESKTKNTGAAKGSAKTSAKTTRPDTTEKGAGKTSATADGKTAGAQKVSAKGSDAKARAKAAPTKTTGSKTSDDKEPRTRKGGED
jgi:large subunit ribosomal protein L21